MRRMRGKTAVLGFAELMFVIGANGMCASCVDCMLYVDVASTAKYGSKRYDPVKSASWKAGKE